MQLTSANRGQVVKEFLAENGIPAALKKKKVVRPSKLKLPGGEVSFPVHTTVSSVKQSLIDDIQSGKFAWENRWHHTNTPHFSTTGKPQPSWKTISLFKEE